MIGWLIDIIPTERPSDVMDAPEAYRAAWGRYVGEVVPGDGDPEDWREQASRQQSDTKPMSWVLAAFDGHTWMRSVSTWSAYLKRIAISPASPFRVRVR